MARIKYYYDTETCKYERVKTTWGDVVLNSLGILSLTLAMAAGLYLLFSNYFESPRELMLRNEVKELQYYYANLKDDVEKMKLIQENMEYRDDNIYRAVLGAEPIDNSVRSAGVGGSDRYAELRDKEVINKEMILGLWEEVDKLKRQMYIEMKSQDEVVKLAENKEKLFAAIPAIQPVHNKELYALSSGFGIRIHPVYKVKKMHPGIDFAASIGTPVYATADGTISVVSLRFSGYGKMIEIEHGFGYRTRYAHLHDFAVRQGQYVKRGELIGYVGNTGLSTAPHLHYEVFVNGQQINPVHYFFNDLNAEEYEKILELASIENMSLGM
jgi:murein DD-endopeptidase MepM/ murein hydrolase activator NlpD